MAVAAEQIAELTVPARAEQLKLVRALVGNAAENAGCRAETASQIVIAVNEACMNVIQHGYKGDKTGEIALEIINNAPELVVRLTDSAPPADVDAIRPRDLDDLRPGGLGTHFISTVMDKVSYSVSSGGGGNRLEMRKRIT